MKTEAQIYESLSQEQKLEMMELNLMETEIYDAS